MKYTEVKPGVYLTSDNKIVYLLSRCPCCGGTDVLSHSKYSDKCDKCGKLYNIYTVRRSQRKNGTIGNKALVAHKEVIDELLALKEAGYGIPGSVDEEALIVAEELRSKNVANIKPKNVGTCNYCGEEAELRTKKRICDDCEVKLTWFKSMYRRLKYGGRINATECDELVDMIEYYRAMERKQLKVPRYEDIIRPLNECRTNYGLHRYKLYGGKKNEEV